MFKNLFKVLTDQSSDSTSNPLKIFFLYLKPYKIQIVVAILALLFSALIILVVGFGLQKFVDQGLNASNRHFITSAFIFIITCALILASTAFIRMTTTSWLSEQVTQDLRRDLFKHLLTFNAVILENLKTSDLIVRFENDTALVRSALNSSIAVALRSSIQILGSVIFLMMTSLKLTGFVLLVIPLCSLSFIFLGKRVRFLTQETYKKQHALSIFIHETLSSLKTVQAFCQEEHQAKRFEDLSICYLKTTHLKGRARALIVALIIAIVFGSIALTLWIGAQDVFQNKISFGQLSAFIFYAVVAAGSLNSLSDVSGEIMSAIHGFKRICDLKKITPTLIVRTNSDSYETPSFSASHPLTVRFKDVTFSYPSRSEIPALHHLSFKIQAGQTIAVVGPSGAGKSTLFELLLRFYDPQEGQILIGNKDIKDLPLSTLRSIFAIVPQEPDIFDLSLQENIAFSHPDAASNALKKAADLALVNEFIPLLPQGYETIVGEQGTRLSGGQKQRLAIARAMLYEAPILLLDEATNALDAKSEYHVQKALDLAFKEKTRLVIAHRLTTVVHADHILVLDQGHLVEQGTHQELIQRNGLYAHLAKHQFSDEQKNI